MVWPWLKRTPAGDCSRVRPRRVGRRCGHGARRRRGQAVLTADRPSQPVSGLRTNHGTGSCRRPNFLAHCHHHHHLLRLLLFPPPQSNWPHLLLSVSLLILVTSGSRVHTKKANLSLKKYYYYTNKVITWFWYSFVRFLLSCLHSQAVVACTWRLVSYRRDYY